MSIENKLSIIAIVMTAIAGLWAIFMFFAENSVKMSEFQSGINYPGNNFETIVSVESPRDCSDLCKENDLCKAWGFRSDGNEPDYKSCWLKTGLSNSTNEKSVTSGYKIFKN